MPPMTKRALTPGPFVVPMPVALVGAYVDGKPNFMVAAFLGIADFNPPVVTLGLSPSHHTVRGIEAERVFSLNLPHADLVVDVDHCGLVSGARADKSTVFSVTRGANGAPLIDACRLSAECRLRSVTPGGVDNLYVAEVIAVQADEAVLDGDSVDWAKVEPLLFTFPDKSYWRLGAHVARAWSVGRGHR
jgi:flavin reductase (DIM6/NTAB) family NADH-FMN oxidoreductase RutF